MSDEADPVPKYFSWRYIFWFCWVNALTILSTIQGSIAALLLAADDATNPLVSHRTYKLFVAANAILMVIVAQAKKNNPPGPPPTKS